jgi:Reverse transcriptase (RNA-dependent DNA polymerase)
LHLKSHGKKIVTNRLSWFLEINNKLNPCQSGFRAHRSTQDNVTILNDAIFKAFSDQEHLIGIFLDFEKAYDMTWRKGILIKLNSLGISGKLFSYIKNILSNISIQVKIGSFLSPTFETEEGVMQGSVIGPLLFLIMINDLNKNLSYINTLIYADDSTIYKSGNSQFPSFKKL